MQKLGKRRGPDCMDQGAKAERQWAGGEMHRGENQIPHPTGEQEASQSKRAEEFGWWWSSNY